MKTHARLSFQSVKTNSVFTRKNLVTIANMAQPYTDEISPWPVQGNEESAFAGLVDRIVEARAAGKPVIWSMGAHVIKNGMSRYVIEMVRHGILTHVSGNGATSIHDFELAFLGETSEDVAASIEDGSFGMWEETGKYMNEAVQHGVTRGWGYGESLYRYLERNPQRFPHYEDCVFVQCQLAGVPYTCHISIGTDIIHQHPIVDFEALGATSGRDFDSMCSSIAGLADGGVFLNFGSAISGPEIFLKALSLCRNKGLPMRDITAANFDIVPVWADTAPSEEQSEYYYRPRRNMIDRLQKLGGEGLLFHGLHDRTIPQLFRRVLQRKQELEAEFVPPGKPLPPHRNEHLLYPVSSRPDRLHASGIGKLDELQEKGWSGEADPAFRECLSALERSRQEGRSILVNLGGNVVGSGMNSALISLIRRGYITHLALNGAAAFQDYELAAFGHTEEDDSDSLQRGRLGMWKEPGERMHDCLKRGYAQGLGYGESLMKDMEDRGELYPYKAYSLIFACLEQGIPCTVHITLGTDAIQQHPDVDYGIQGGASGRDFRIYAHTVSGLDGGAFLNFGSTVTGPEVFLKALSISRNLGHTVSRIMTANFDIVRLGDYHAKVGYEDWDYYYRPRKNIIHRPTSLGGKGYHFEGLHRETIAALGRMLNP
ncbi:hypothetical protein M6D81_28980 [Paenibacillus sp. J5C_2022]|uniref:hypothetical protein n=1 Tax=Paenibacillus sp. J5C2022 TaxID=2977129 RepID=UPI0021D36CBF|nr:hypothetical protein [Paenibacillus sp. J5C2022]MCU6712742.1 hypothetical protein [Paenibacillus sp. J5C2022]